MALGDFREAGGSKAERSIEVLEDEITTLAAQLSAATYHLLTLIAEFDRREGWGRYHRLVHEGGVSIALSGEEVVVRRADGRVIHAVPRSQPVRDSAESISRGNAARGIEIDARTGTPGWGGERADYSYIVAMLDDHAAPRGVILE